MSNFGERVIRLNKNLQFDVELPEDIRVMNPFKENPAALEISSAFYRKFYGDNRERKLILGINPGRLGAGLTGIPFTDTKRLSDPCGLQLSNVKTHEPSSVFVYELIKAFGGVVPFYQEFFIHSVCPLGFVIRDKEGKEKNFNYYDRKALLDAARPFIVKSINEYLELGVSRRKCYCWGKGKNFKFLNQLNKEEKFFEEVIGLNHPRFIVQYRLKKMPEEVKNQLDQLTR